MKVWFDTEFIEDGKTIDLISIGAVRDDGRMFYAENLECDRGRASLWVKENVLPKLSDGQSLMSRSDIARDFVLFSGENPEFWAYYADYDWVVLCQLFGTMMDLPQGWPMYCRDIRQCYDDIGLEPPKQESAEHNALNDARWAKSAYEALEDRRPSSADDVRLYASLGERLSPVVPREEES